MTKIAEAYVEVRTNQAKFTKELKSMEKTVKTSTDKMKKNFDRIGKGVTEISRVARLGFIAMAAAIAGTVYAAAKYEKQMATVSTMLSRKSMPIMDKYKDLVGKMGIIFGESTETLSDGLYDILSASIRPEKALKVLAISAKAAAAGLTDTGVAADAITTIINSYGYAASDAGKISDILFAIVKRGKTTFAELAPAIGKVAATAAIADISFEELGAAIATITRAGIRTDEAMTSVNGIIRAFLKPTDDAAKAARKFGFELNTNTLRTIGLQGVLELLTDATAEQTAEMFPNIRGLKAIAAAMQDLEGYTEDYKLMLESAGLTQEAYTKQTNTLTFTFNQLKEAGKYLAVQIGEIFTPIVSQAIKKITDQAIKLGQAIKGLTTDQKNSVAQMVLFGTAVLGAIGALSLFSVAARLVVAAGSIIAGTLGLIFSPLGLLIIGISALVLAWTLGWKKIKEITSKLVEVVVMPVIKWGSEKLDSLADWMREKSGLPKDENDYFDLGDFKAIVRFLGNLVWKGIEAAGVAIDNLADWIREEMGLPKDENKLADWADISVIIGFVGDLIWQGMKSAGKAINDLVLWIQEKMGISEEARKGIWELTDISVTLGFIADLVWKGIESAGKAITDITEWVKKNAKLDKPLDELIVSIADFLIELPEPTKWFFKIGTKIWQYVSLGIGIWWTAKGLLSAIKFAPIALPALLPIIVGIGLALVGIDVLGSKLKEKLDEAEIDEMLTAFSAEYPTLFELSVGIKEITGLEVPTLLAYINEKWDTTAKKLSLIPFAGQILLDIVLDIEMDWSKAWEHFKEDLKDTWDRITWPVLSWERFVVALQEAWDNTDWGWFGNSIKWMMGLFKKDIEEMETVLEIDWNSIWGDKASAQTREAIDNISELRKTVEKEIGEKIPKEFDALIIALAASESAFDSSATNMGGAAVGLGQMTKEALEDVNKSLKKAGSKWEFTLEDMQDPVKNLQAMIIYFGIVSKRNDRDLVKSITYWKGWGKEIKKSGGELKKMPPEAQKQFKAFIKICEEFGIDAVDLMTLIGKKMVGGSGGIIGELEEGTKKVKSELGKMSGEMSKMVDGMSKIFMPIIGLFKKIVEGIVDAMLKSEDEAIRSAGEGLKAFIDETLGAIDAMFGGMEEGTQEMSLEVRRLFRDIEVDVKETAKEITEEMIDAWENIVNSAREALTNIASGAKTMGEAFGDIAKKIQTMLSDALWNAAKVAMATGDVITGVLLGLGSILVSALGTPRVSEFQKAWEEFGENMKEMFTEVGLVISETIEDAQMEMANVLQSQVELEASTRDKLITELDKYYDYRELKEMTFTELVELAAKTREEVESGTLEKSLEERIKYLQSLVDAEKATDAEIEELAKLREESTKEATEREKDAKISALEAIIEAHDKEQKMIDYKIALMKVEMKQLESTMLLEQARAEGNLEKKEELRLASVAAAEEAMRMLKELETYWDETEEATEAVTEATEDAIEATKELGKEGKKTAEEAKTAVEEWSKEIKKIPRHIDFDIVGDLHMPEIPRLGRQYFDIIGKYHAPEIPSYQVGIPYVPRTQVAVIHKGEAVIPAHENRVGRAGGNGGTKVVYERGAIRMTVMGSINQQVDLEEAMDYLAKKQTEKLRRP